MQQATKINQCVCVFGAASDGIDEKYKEVAHYLGAAFAKSGIGIVFGAGGSGVMGALARGVHSESGSIVGVLPELLNKPGVVSEYCSAVIVTASMHERKITMEKMADAYIALAGGYGTLEELLEVIVQKQLGYFNSPICIVNTDGYFDALIDMFDRIIQDGFANTQCTNLYHIANTGEAAFEYISGTLNGV